MMSLSAENAEKSRIRGELAADSHIWNGRNTRCEELSASVVATPVCPVLGGGGGGGLEMVQGVVPVPRTATVVASWTQFQSMIWALL